jgi:hypothetical protein
MADMQTAMASAKYTLFPKRYQTEQVGKFEMQAFKVSLITKEFDRFIFSLKFYLFQLLRIQSNTSSFPV